MSRIQDILAKAERDGTARRTQSSTGVAQPSQVAVMVAPIVAPIDGSSALDAAFMGASLATPSEAASVASRPELVDPLPLNVSVRPERVEARAASATLHPALVAAIAPHSTVAEQYRTIRTRIAQREERMPLRIMMVTSPGAGDGKSVTAANLALTMAQEQRRIVLVDADLRGASIHSLFGIETAVGLAEVLNGEATLDDALVYLPDYQLTLLPAGGRPQFPTELLGSAAMRRTMDLLRARFDRILLDVPAVIPLADTRTVAPMADAILMVVRAGTTQRPALDQALAGLDDAKMLGIVLNEAR